MGKIQAQLIKLKSGLPATIKACESKDAEFFPRFAELVGKETPFTRFSTMDAPTAEQTAVEWDQDYSRSDRLHLGVFLDGQMLACLKFKQPYPEHEGYRHVGEFGIMVLREFWGQGIALQLMKEMESYAKTAGALRIEAKVRDGHEKAISFFKFLGYEIEGVRRGAVRVGADFVNEYYIGKVRASRHELRILNPKKSPPRLFRD